MSFFEKKNKLSIKKCERIKYLVDINLLKYVFFSIDTDDTKGRGGSLEDSFKPLQVGFTNPASTDQRDSSPKVLPSSGTAVTSTRDDRTPSPSSRQNQTIQNIPYAVPITPSKTSTKPSDYEQGLSIIYLS